MLQEIDSTIILCHRVAEPDTTSADVIRLLSQQSWRCDKIQRLAAVGHDADDIAHNVLQSSLGERTKIESRLGKFFWNLFKKNVYITFLYI